MKPVAPPYSPGLTPLVLGAGQPEYEPLPAARTADGSAIVTEWEVSPEDAANLRRGGRVRITLLTFGKPLQPMLVETVEPCQSIGLKCGHSVLIPHSQAGKPGVFGPCECGWTIHVHGDLQCPIAYPPDHPMSQAPNAV